MAERRRPNARTRQRRSYQPALPPELRSPPAGRDPSDPERQPTAREALERWKRRITRARRLRREWADHYMVETLERAYLGTQLASGEQCDIFLNHFFATVQVQRPALLPAKLTFLVTPKPGQRHADALMARAQASVLDTIALQDGHLMKSLRLAMAQAFFRCGVLKACYEPRMEPNPRAGEPLLGEDEQALLGSEGARLVEPDALLSDEVYRWQWVNAQHMLLPDEGPDTTRWSWIAEEIEVPLDEAQDDPRFAAEVRRQLRANGRAWDPLSATEAPAMDTGEDRDDAMLRYLECWDIRHKRLFCWAEGQTFDGVLRDEATPDGVEDHPYALLLPVPILGPKPSAWPMPLTYNWLPMQEQYNILRRQQIEAGKRAARKVVYDDATFPDADEAQKFLESPADMQGVKITDIQRPPLVLGDGAQSPDVSRNIPYLLNDWQRITGATGTRLGSPDSNTATESVLAEQSAAVRDSELRTQVHEWLAEAGRKMLQLVKQTLTLDMWITLKEMGDAELQQFLRSPGMQAYFALRVGPEQAPAMVEMFQHLPGMTQQLKERFGQLQPLRVSRSQLQMEADVSVVPSTMRPVYRAQLLQLAGLLGPALLLSPTLVEELLSTFELPQGDRIAEELLTNLAQQGGLAALRGRGTPTQDTPNAASAARPMSPRSPLGAATGRGGL